MGRALGLVLLAVDLLTAATEIDACELYREPAGDQADLAIKRPEGVH